MPTLTKIHRDQVFRIDFVKAASLLFCPCENVIFFSHDYISLLGLAFAAYDSNVGFAKILFADQGIFFDAFDLTLRTLDDAPAVGDTGGAEVAP